MAKTAMQSNPSVQTRKASYAKRSLKTKQHTTPDELDSHTTPFQPTIWIPLAEVHHMGHRASCISIVSWVPLMQNPCKVDADRLI